MVFSTISFKPEFITLSHKKTLIFDILLKKSNEKKK